jgi:flagellar hook-associated protein 1 FlgK
MSLFSSIQVGASALQATQIGLQVAGQNIANASTPGYIREEAVLSPGPTQHVGDLLEGTGVEVQGITQDVNTFLEQQLRGANSDQANASINNQTYTQLQGVLGALNSTNLDTSLASFFSSIANVLNQPEDSTVRNQAVLNGQALAGTFNSLNAQVDQLRSNLNTQVVSDAGTVNSLLTQINSLNTQIATLTGGNNLPSAAVGLTDARNSALSSLSQLMNIKVQEQPDGTMTVYSGGQYLVNEGVVRQVQVDNSTNRGQQVANLALAGSDTPLSITSGEVAGLINSRDNILGGFVDQLNSLAGTLSSEFNKIYSTGQGLSGYTQVTSATPVSNADAPLDETGLAVTPVTGDFQVQVYNTQTGLSQNTDVHVVESGLGDDTTLNSLAAQLNSISGLSATVNAQGQLTIATTAANTQVAFSGDTSGALAALGINTFFTGSDAGSLSVNSAAVQDPSTFAASAGGVGVDTNVAQQLANFANVPLASQGGSTLTAMQNTLVANVTQGANVAQSASDGATSFQQSLQSQETSVSGVSLDEETVSMLEYQHDYEASARFISTISSLLDQLVQL